VHPGLTALHEYLDATARWDEELVRRHDTSEPVSVTCDLVEAMPIEPEPIVEVRADVADPPQLGFAGTQGQRRVDETVDGARRADADAPIGALLLAVGAHDGERELVLAALELLLSDGFSGG